MRIATFNVNNVVKRLANLLEWLAEARAGRGVPAGAEGAGRRTFRRRRWRRPAMARSGAGSGPGTGWRSCRGAAEPVMTRDALPGDPADAQARYVEAAVEGVLVGCLYAPNGNPQPGPKFDYKLAWHARLRGACGGAAGGGGAGGAGGGLQRGAGGAGHLSDDLLRRERADPAGEPGGLCGGCWTQGWTDAIRAVHPEGPVYTFWDYRRMRWERDGGMRLDHFLLSPERGRAAAGAPGVDRWVRGRENASDHAPVWIELAAAGRRRR